MGGFVKYFIQRRIIKKSRSGNSLFSILSILVNLDCDDLKAWRFELILKQNKVIRVKPCWRLLVSLFLLLSLTFSSFTLCGCVGEYKLTEDHILTEMPDSYFVSLSKEVYIQDMLDYSYLLADILLDEKSKWSVDLWENKDLMAYWDDSGEMRYLYDDPPRFWNINQLATHVFNMIYEYDRLSGEPYSALRDSDQHADIPLEKAHDFSKRFGTYYSITVPTETRGIVTQNIKPIFHGLLVNVLFGSGVCTTSYIFGDAIAEIILTHHNPRSQ